ncbi:unnamed protein product [Ceratitis capitata]|nr:unnamed protein product [Ceratitis capitata]
MKSSLPVSETDREGNVNSEADASNAQLSIEDSNNPCTVIITHKSNPKLKLSNKEFQRIKSKLLEEIDESEDFDTNFGFLSSVLENGWIKLTCQNTGTREWVLKTINKLNTSLEMDLMASISIAFPKTFICTINLSAEDIITEDALKRRLAKQNKDLSTEEWTLLHNVKLEDGGESFVYCIDEKSKEHIEAAEKKLFLNFSQIFIDIADDT